MYGGLHWPPLASLGLCWAAPLAKMLWLSGVRLRLPSLILMAAIIPPDYNCILSYVFMAVGMVVVGIAVLFYLFFSFLCFLSCLLHFNYIISSASSRLSSFPPPFPSFSPRSLLFILFVSLFPLSSRTFCRALLPCRPVGVPRGSNPWRRESRGQSCALATAAFSPARNAPRYRGLANDTLRFA